MAIVMSPANTVSVTKWRPKTTPKDRLRRQRPWRPRARKAAFAAGRGWRNHRPEGLGLPPPIRTSGSPAAPARPPPRLEGGRSRQTAERIGAQASPISLEQKIGRKPRSDQEGAEEIEHDRRRNQRPLARKDELAQESEDGWQEQEEGHPVGGPPGHVPFGIDGEGEFGGARIEEPR